MPSERHVSLTPRFSEVLQNDIVRERVVDACDTSLKRGGNKSGYSDAADSFCGCCFGGAGRAAAARSDAFLRRKYATRRLRFSRTLCCCPIESLWIENPRNAIRLKSIFPLLVMAVPSPCERKAARLRIRSRYLEKPQ
jgi:hypothetical protein